MDYARLSKRYLNMPVAHSPGSLSEPPLMHIGVALPILAYRNRHTYLFFVHEHPICVEQSEIRFVFRPIRFAAKTVNIV